MDESKEMEKYSKYLFFKSAQVITGDVINLEYNLEYKNLEFRKD